MRCEAAPKEKELLHYNWVKSRPARGGAGEGRVYKTNGYFEPDLEVKGEQ